MLDGNRIAALLLMGGSGRRFGSQLPKQFHRLAGKSVYLHTLEALIRAGCFDEIVLSCHPDWIETVRGDLPDAPCPIRVVEGNNRAVQKDKLEKTNNLSSGRERKRKNKKGINIGYETSCLAKRVGFLPIRSHNS